jgi:hypothetical protein
MAEPEPRTARLSELRMRLPGLVRGIQEPGIPPEQKAELAVEYEQVLGAMLALALNSWPWERRLLIGGEPFHLPPITAVQPSLICSISSRFPTGVGGRSLMSSFVSHIRLVEFQVG